MSSNAVTNALAQLQAIHQQFPAVAARSHADTEICLMEENGFHLLPRPVYGERNPAVRFLARYTKSSRVTYERRLRSLARELGAPDNQYEWLDWTAFTDHRVEAFLSNQYEPHLDQNGVETRMSPNTINGYLSTIKGVMRQAWKLDLIDRRQLEGVLEIPAQKVDRPPAGRMIDVQEERELITAVKDYRLKNPVKAARDMAILYLAAYAGVRRFEFTRLQVEHFDFKRARVTIRGKRDKVAEVPLAAPAIKVLQHWLSFRGFDPGYMFLRVYKTGDISDQPLSNSGVRSVIELYQKRAGLSTLTPHDLRRTFVSNVLDVPGMDAATAMKMARHSSFNTTAIYDRRPEEKQEKAMDYLAQAGADLDPTD